MRDHPGWGRCQSWCHQATTRPARRDPAWRTAPAKRAVVARRGHETAAGVPWPWCRAVSLEESVRFVFAMVVPFGCAGRVQAHVCRDGRGGLQPDRRGAVLLL